MVGDNDANQTHNKIVPTGSNATIDRNKDDDGWGAPAKKTNVRHQH